MWQRIKDYFNLNKPVKEPEETEEPDYINLPPIPRFMYVTLYRTVQQKYLIDNMLQSILHINDNVYIAGNHLLPSINDRVSETKEITIGKNSFAIGDFFTIRDSIISDVKTKQIISPEEYDNVIKKVVECNCKIGSGKPEIVIAKQYNIIEELNNHFKDYYFENYPSKYFSDFYYLYRNDCLDAIITDLSDSDFHFAYKQQACITCGTCLDEKKKLIDKFTDIIESIEKKIQDRKNKIQMVKEICEG